MTAQPAGTPGPTGDPGRPVGAYTDRRARSGGTALDELVRPDGSVREAARDLAASVDLLGTAGLLTRRAQARRLVEDDGVTYGTPDEARDGVRGTARPVRTWAIDPLPVVLDAAEWAGLETGLRERATLLDAVLADLYGPRVLLREGVVPPEVVLGHPGFLRAADQVRVAGARQLFLTATDLGRGPDGGWTVLADRTQAPSGAGYAMENRRIVSRVLPGLYRDTPLERLRGFFHTVRAALAEVAPAGAEAPRVVLLTPGTASETAFDQAFLATLLGYPLVEGGDLTVREGRVRMRSLGRLEPVDVVLRRVDAWFSDPLELRPDSRLGVPGLLEAARTGAVSVVNPLGAGVLENPGLLPFLPRAAKVLLGAGTVLPAVPTYWLGDPAERSHVLSALDRFVVKPIGRAVGRASVFGWELSAAGRDDLRRRIEADPGAWCGQEPLDMSTAPVVTSRGLESRHLVVRTFAVAQGGAYRLMSGGLARVAGRAGSRFVSSSEGALAKDVWVLSPDARMVPGVMPLEGVADSLTLVAPAPVVPALAPRVAEDLFWLGRYAERAEDAARLLRVVDDLAEDHARRPETVGGRALDVLVAAARHATATAPGPGDVTSSGPHAELLRLSVEAFRPGTLAFAVRRTVEVAHAVREQLSLDTWVVLGGVERVVAELAERAAAAAPGDSPPLQPTLARVLEGLLAFAGLGAESMVRDTGWYFMDLGRRLERSLHLVSLLRGTLVRARAAAVDALVLESVLVAGESVITFRRRHPGGPGRPDAGAPVSVGTGGGTASQVAGVLDLLLADRTNPRSLAYQLDRAEADLRHLPEPQRSVALDRGLRSLAARLREADPATLALAGADGGRPALEDLLAVLERELSDLATAVEAAHFVHAAPLRPMPVAAPGWQS